MRSLRLLPKLALAVTLLLLGVPILRAGNEPEITPATPEALAAIAHYGDMARRANALGNPDLTETLYQKLLAVDSPDDTKRQALFEMFDFYRLNQSFSKAIAVGERVHQSFPTDPDTAQLLLNLGKIYRDTGAYDLAITRFYNVLNASLRVDPANFAKYQDFSKQAQFEIADTFMTAGNYRQAGRMYSLLDKLDLKDDERATAEFQSAYCIFLNGDFPGSVAASRHFLEKFSANSYAPQCHYMLSIALKSMGQAQAATDETLALLKMEKKVQSTDVKTWTYWQRKTGNQLANGFYQEGDFLRALTIYQAMAKLSQDPAWQLPVLYQAGLCFERLHFPDRATEAYQYILDQSKKATASGKTLDADLTELGTMAQWRTDHLTWKQGTEAKLNDLLGNQPPGDATLIPDNPAATASLGH